MTSLPTKWVRYYHRGFFTALELATRVVEATAQRPTKEFVASLPADTLNRIRTWAAEPVGTPVVSITVAIGADPDAWAAQHQYWQQCLAYWREYFAEEKP